MSTRQESPRRLTAHPPRIGIPARVGPLDAVETVALVARSRRERLLAVHARRLVREDLEDCYSQATLELLTRARRPGAFASRAHIVNALEQRLLSRIHDRRRALSGRSPIEAAIATALPLAGSEDGGVQISDARADIERLTFAREELRRVIQLSRRLSADQRLVLAHQIACDMDCREFCHTHGWSSEKYRKVAQRARARLVRLLADERLATRGERSAGDGNSHVPLSVRSSDQSAGTYL